MQVCFGARGEKACNGVKGVQAEEGRWPYVFSGMGRSEMLAQGRGAASDGTSVCAQLGGGGARRAGTGARLEECCRARSLPQPHAGRLVWLQDLLLELSSVF